MLISLFKPSNEGFFIEATSMQAAFDYMIKLINDGYEYPDAEWKASNQFNVSSDELREMYDEKK